MATMVILLFATFASASAASEYRVGDGLWSIPPHPGFYSNWSSSRTFTVGDALVFEFDSQYYDLIQVSARDHESCTWSNPFRTFRVSPAVIQFLEDGVFYFTTSVANYCLLGLKVALAVQPPAGVGMGEVWISPTSSLSITEKTVPGGAVSGGGSCWKGDVHFVTVILLLIMFLLSA